MLGYPNGGGVSPTVQNEVCPQHTPFLTENNSPNHFLALTLPPPLASKEHLLANGTTRGSCCLPRPATRAACRTKHESDCFAHNPYTFINDTHCHVPNIPPRS